MRVMLLAVLPVLVLIGWAAVAAGRFGWRDGLLIGFTCWLTGWLLLAGALSVVSQFNAGGVAVGQVLQLVVQAVLLWRRRPALPDLRGTWRNPWVLVLAAEASALLVLVMSVAPTNWDSMSYHLVKVAQWMQAEQVGSFPAEFAPQVYMPFVAELGMAQFLMLSGELWSTGLVQYSAHLVALVAISVLARNVGVDSRGQAIAAGVFGLAPLVVGQAVTTQTDYVMCTLVVIAFAMATRRPGGAWWLVPVALASGLAVAVKPIAVLMVWPAIVLSVRHLRGVELRRMVAPLAASVLVGVAVNAWWMGTNQMTWGSVTGVESSLTNEEVSVGTVASNLVRNLTNQVALPDAGANDKLEAGVRRALDTVGIDADDQGATLGTYVVDSYRTEDRAANPLQVALILVAVVVMLLGGRSRRALWPVALSMVLVNVAMAAVLKWQMFNGRFMLTAIALGAVLVGAAWARWPRWIAVVTLVALTAQSLPYLLNQNFRPLIGERSVLTTTPEEELFAGRPGLAWSYQHFADSLEGQDAPRVGIAHGMWMWEFPMWWLVKQVNPTAILGSAAPCPETVPDSAPEPQWDVVITWEAVSGEKYLPPPGCAH